MTKRNKIIGTMSVVLFANMPVLLWRSWRTSRIVLQSLPESQQKALPQALRIDTSDYQMRAAQYKEAAIRNQFCLDCILRHSGMPISQQANNNNEATANGGNDEAVGSIVSDGQLSKTSSVLKSLARDWSIEGKPEREMAYGPLVRQLKQYVPLPRADDADAKPPPRICVPGAGRLSPCSFENQEWTQFSVMLTLGIVCRFLKALVGLLLTLQLWGTQCKAMTSLCLCC
jgi:hypothetical protein